MSIDAKKIIDDSFRYLVKTYAPQPVVMDHGKGCYAFDTSGKKYVDCAAGIAVASLGHAHPAMLKTINEQAARMMACQASYTTKEKFKAAKLLVETSCFDLVYFSNSGTESVEAALKCARKWAYDEKGEDCNEIIAFHNSFHGRTYGSASVTEKRNSQPFFAPYLPGVHFATFNDIDSVKTLATDKTAAVIIEPIQGEGGLTPANPEFLKALRQFCDEKNICLIFDEVQAGFGRLGALYAYQSFGVEPDIVTWAKGMGSGFPVGAMAAKRKFGDALEVGMHGTTYGGNPLACAVVVTVLEEMLKPGFMEHVNKISGILFDGLNEIKRSSNKITDIRGKGLMIGVDTVFDIKNLMRALQSNGLMTTQAGKETLRLTPPLILSEDEAKEALEIIEKTLSEMGE
ncbi:MAG TPA: acetylornithine/succinylornithine family transaminase [Alphaproteobacteria bacterium]|nr:acetylornithine/succinylornithine family transaminase [Alphaproteobacteria bacterium]USO04703.1 MAG: acetylornithine/succinylornithine family transaminase [Rhodospirillales bacterium]HOO82723.1 acetylornithine/succinylornithine family transaminase [Alphaproteobacteria bacterium]